MKVLVDECVDWRFARDIPGHEVKTAQSDGLDGDQERRAVVACRRKTSTCSSTVDRNLSFQQNLGSSAIAVVVLQAKTNRLPDLKPLAPRLLAAIESALPGAVKLIAAD